MAKLSEIQRRFCDEYLQDLNATQAYIRAGYRVKSPDVATVNALRLLKKPTVQAYIEQRQLELQKKTEISQERILAELVAIGFSDAVDYAAIDGGEVTLTDTGGLSKLQRAAIAGIKQGRNGIELRLYDKLRAMELLCRIMGYIKDGGPPAQTGDNGLSEALQVSGEGAFREILEIQQETASSAELVDASADSAKV